MSGRDKFLDDLFAGEKATAKRCWDCKRTKPVSMFQKNRTKKDGLQGECRECSAERSKAYHARPEVKAHVVERTKAYNAKYNAKNRERIRERKREYNVINRERIRERKREYYVANRERDRKREREYYIKNRERRHEYMGEYYIANRERQREYGAEYRKTPRGRAVQVAKNHKRRAAKLNQGLPRHDPRYVSAEFIQFVRAMWGNACAACGSTDRLTLDHMVPLARGGEHSTDNCSLILCQSCNSSKNAKTLEEWAASLREGEASLVMPRLPAGRPNPIPANGHSGSRSLAAGD